VQASPSSGQVVGQFPSQSSGGSTTLLPQVAVQLLSLFALHPVAQHPSPFAHIVIGGWVHCRLHMAAEPVRTSAVQELPSFGHVVGQFPSQSSGGSITLLPHTAVQLPSLVALHPVGQHPSPFTHIVIGGWVHCRLHMAAEPVRTSAVQAIPSSGQVVGQFPSQVSPGSTTLLPQVAVQLLSLLALQPMGQQPSPPVHIVIGVLVHARVHIEPVSVSAVQLFPSLQDVGQFPSQVSPGSITPFPHMAVQFGSFVALQPVGQQPSPPVHTIFRTPHPSLSLVAA
jgi:hypothetical protein